MGTEDLDWLHDDEDGQDGDGNGRESEEAEMRREWQCRFEKLHNFGFQEGFEEGRNEALQKGFDAGFASLIEYAIASSQALNALERLAAARGEKGEARSEMDTRIEKLQCSIERAGRQNAKTTERNRDEGLRKVIEEAEHFLLSEGIALWK